MTDREYINVQELMLVNQAIEAMKQIVPENSKVITVQALSDVAKTLYTWQAGLFKQIKIKK